MNNPVMQATARRVVAAQSDIGLWAAPTRTASRLDLLAGVELQQGHYAAAERLAWRAAELRERQS